MIALLDDQCSLSNGALKDVLSLDDPSAIVAAVKTKPYLREPLQRAIDSLQTLWVEELSKFVGVNGELAHSLGAADLASAVACAEKIRALSLVAIAISTETDRGPFTELAIPKPPDETIHDGQIITAEGVVRLFSTLPHTRVLTRYQELQSERDLRNQSAALQTRLHDFVAATPGGVRIDKFIFEHQLGDCGFYSSQLDFIQELGQTMVSTPSMNREGYAESMANNVFGIVRRYVVDEIQSQSGRNFVQDPITFVEIGGGRGDFKDAFLLHSDSLINGDAPISLRYVSVDINPFQLLVQARPGTVVVKGTACETGLADSSVDILFDEEVVDCFPHRIFQWSKDEKRIVAEAYVVIKEEHLDIEFKPVDVDGELAELSSFLAGSDYQFDVYRYSEWDSDYWRESRRVLREGGMRLTADYTNEWRHRIANQQLGSLRAAINLPYMNDITRGIDPAWMIRLAEREGFTCRQMPYDEGAHGFERVIISGRKNN